MEGTPEQENNNNNLHHQHSSSEDRKLMIKLKIPKLGSQETDLLDQINNNNNSVVAAVDSSPVNMIQPNNTPRVCPQCKKEFGSGKALGGHMRIHAEAIKKQKKLVSPVFYNKRSCEESMFVDDQDDSRRTGVLKNNKAVCSLCGKKFPSMKSLFGHMRCHPEREWRGIQPPNEQLLTNHYNSSSSLSESLPDEDNDDADDDVEPVFDVLEPMPKWSVKGKRGRKAVNNKSSSEEEESDEEEEESEEEEEEEEEKLRAVNDLMLLKQLDCSESSGVSFLAAASKKRGDVVDQHQEERINKRGEESEFHKFLNGFEKLSIKNEMKRSLFDAYDGTAADDHVIKKLRFDEKTSVIDKCPIGLDGNGSGVENQGAVDIGDEKGEEESNRKNDIRNNFDGISNNVEMVMGSKNKRAKKMKRMMDLDSSVAQENTLAPEKYKCSTCNKCFSSHQALGGHRSSHNKFKLTIINGDATTEHPHQSSFVSAAPDHDHQQQQVIISNAVEECVIKHTSTDEGAGSSKAAADHIVHQCKVCNKIFPSGQALGGHKRCHWTTTPADQFPAQVVTSSGEEASQTGGSRVGFLGIDLNVTPPMEEHDDAEGGSGAGMRYSGPATSWLYL